MFEEELHKYKKENGSRPGIKWLRSLVEDAIERLNSKNKHKTWKNYPQREDQSDKRAAGLVAVDRGVEGTSEKRGY